MKKYLISLLSYCFLTSLVAEEAQPPEYPVVVGIHGFMASKKSFRCINRSMCCEGFKMYNFGYNSFSGNIRSHGHDLACYLACVAQQNPGQEINFFTQSLGALILRAALNDPACPEEAKTGKAVLVAPPNQGSELGRSFDEIGDLYKCLGFELAYELSNYTYHDIQCIGLFPEEMEILIIAGSKGTNFWTCEKNDGVITLSETAIDHSFYFQSYPVNHMRILSYPPAIRLAQFFIRCGFEEKKEEEAKTEDPCPLPEKCGS
jgi:hypothetical protein